MFLNKEARESLLREIANIRFHLEKGKVSLWHVAVTENKDICQKSTGSRRQEIRLPKVGASKRKMIDIYYNTLKTQWHWKGIKLSKVDKMYTSSLENKVG